MKSTIVIISLAVLLIGGCKSPQKKILKEPKQIDMRTFNYTPYFNDPNLKEEPIAKLILPSGKIIAGDPFFISNVVPFSKIVPPGEYPVSIFMSKIGEDHYRVAFARIKFKESKAVRWELAVTDSITQKDIDSLQPGDFFGYGVDAGLGCFTDLETNKLYNAVMDSFYKNNSNGNYYTDILEEEFKTADKRSYSRSTGDWNNHFPKKGSPLNVVMFSSGWGDGHYPSYWGFNEKNEIVELITDFFVVTE